MLLLLGSAALYVMTRLTGLNLSSWDDSGGWYLNPFAWQLLFMVGAILAYAPPRMPRVRWPLDLLSALVLFVASFIRHGHPLFSAAAPAGYRTASAIACR